MKILRTPSSGTGNTTNAPAERPPSRWRVLFLYALAAATIVAVPAAGASKKKVAKSKRTTIKLATNVRESTVRASSAFVRLGSFDSKRAKYGEITVECKGANAPACRMTSSVVGPLRLKNNGAVAPGVYTTIGWTQSATGSEPVAAGGKGKNRTPGGVGGGGGGGTKGTKAPNSTAAPSSSPGTSPPNTGIFDIDIEWNPCFFDDALCFEISYDMGGDGVMAGPDGSGDTVDGQQGDIVIIPGGNGRRPGL